MRTPSSNEMLIAPDKAAGSRREFVTFVLAGGTSAVFNVAVRWLLSHFMVYELAVALAYLVGMTIAFLLTRLFVFKAGGAGWKSQYSRFALINAVGFVIVLGVSDGLARLLFPAIGFRWYPEGIAHVIGIASPTLFSYYAHKHFSFGAGTRA